MTTEWTEQDFEQLSWHDNHVYAVRLDVGDTEQNEWRSELVFDVDHIVEWVKGENGVLFRVAPATLRFHNVTDLKIHVDGGDSGHQVAINEWSIHDVTREQVKDQKICLDQPYYAWRIELNWPRGGLISFGASGFTQVLRADAVLQDQQKLSSKGRG